MDSLDQCGDACRCLIELAARKQRPISEADFIARFKPRYAIWNDRLGVTDTAMVCDIARDLELAQSVQVLRRYIRVVQCFTNPQVTGVLVFTERFRNAGGHVVPRYNCSLLQEMDASSFSLWLPGLESDSSIGQYSVGDWDIFCAHALILA